MTTNRIVIGVDVGGTNTDAVLLDGETIIEKCKTITTKDITLGIVNAISTLFEKNQDLKKHVQSINIGTTHLLNALLQKQDLNKPLIVRLGAPSTTALPPAIDWQTDMKEQLLGNDSYIVDGGYEFNGNEISPLDTKTLEELAQQALSEQVSSVAITGVFANLNPSQEIEAGAIFNKAYPSIQISLSHTMGELGLLARENATILNACLAEQYQKIKKAFTDAINHLNMKTTAVFLTSGDGTKNNLEDETSTPLRTLNSGPINSIKGASILSRIENAVTVDIGGTSCDVGLLKGGEPVNESSHFKIGGINCNFRSARLNSFGLGGGTIIRIEHNGEISLGPESVGKNLSEKALVFGGDTLTPTDIAVALGRLKIGHLGLDLLIQKISFLISDKDIDLFIRKIDQIIHEKLAQGIIQTLDSIEKIPSDLVLVGGGAVLFDKTILEKFIPNRFKLISIPQSADVANALGAAMSLIGAKYVKIYDYAVISRDIALAEATGEAKKIAVQRGADPASLKIFSITDTPLNYLSGDPNQLSVSIVGKDSGSGYFNAGEKNSTITTLSKMIRISSLIINKTQTKKAEVIEIKRNHIQFRELQTLTLMDIDDIAHGAGLLGSGGGGNPEIGRQMAQYSIKKGRKIQIVSFENLPDNAQTVVCGAMGSPNIAFERLFSVEEGIKAILEMEKSTGKKVDAIVVGEAGGTNAIYPLYMASELGIPVVDADCMGRAFPCLNMMTPLIYGTFNEFNVALSNGRQSEFIQVENEDFSSLEGRIRKAKVLEEKAREATIKMGGSVSFAFLPMTGAQVKQWTIEGTISIATSFGKALRESQGLPFSIRLEALNKIVAKTEYQKAEKLYEGKIIVVRRKELGGFSVGNFIVQNPHTEEKIEIGFQNENLVVRKSRTEEILAQVPDLITIVDKNNFHCICCEDLRYGQEVIILKMTAPKKMKTEQATHVVGPQVYPMKQIFELFRSLKTVAKL